MSGLLKSYSCGETSSPLTYETLGDFFEKIVRAFPDLESVVCRHQNIRKTYKELNEDVDKLALGLIKLGIKQGDRVGIWGPNSYEWTVTQYATAKMGAILVCINPAYRLYELEYALNKVECRAIVTASHFKSSNYLGMLKELAPELDTCVQGQLKSKKLPHLEMIIRMGSDKTSGMFNFNDVTKMGGEKEIEVLQSMKSRLKPDDAINIQFTSGTTGNPKGATLTHCNILNNALSCGVRMNFSEKDRLCIPVPLYHCFGMVMGNLLCMTHGATAIFPNESFDPLTTLEAVEAEKCTALHGVPTMFVTELDHPDFSRFNLKSLRTGIMAGAPCPKEIMKRVIKDMNMSEVMIAYGQTELSPINFMTRIDDPIDKRVETVGKAFPWLEVKIENDEGNVADIGQKGEVCTRGYSVMLGYWNDLEQTEDTIDKAGWLHSGDLGTMDEMGYVQIVGRLKDMVIRGGENVYPREVEEFLYSHPKISEVQVFGIPDKKMGEEVCAWIQVQAGEVLTEDEVKDFCKGQITHFKIPRFVKFVDTYPMTVTGKIQKFIMSDMMAKELKG